MKAVRKYSVCTLVSIGLACTTQAKQDDEKEKKDKGKPDKIEAVYRVDKRHKEDKEKKGKNEQKYKEPRAYNGPRVPVCEEIPNDPSNGPFSIPDAGSTAALLGLTLAVVGLVQRKWPSSLNQRT
jgi:VPDSG-CTERM motif